MLQALVVIFKKFLNTFQHRNCKRDSSILWNEGTISGDHQDVQRRIEKKKSGKTFRSHVGSYIYSEFREHILRNVHLT